MSRLATLQDRRGYSRNGNQGLNRYFDIPIAMRFITIPPPSVGIKSAIDYETDSSQYLSMSSTNFGAYNRDKFAIAFSAKLESLPAKRAFCSKGTTNANIEWEITVDTNGAIQFAGSVSGTINVFRASGNAVLSTGSYYAVLAHFDRAASTSAERMRIWVNGTEHTFDGVMPLVR